MADQAPGGKGPRDRKPGAFDSDFDNKPPAKPSAKVSSPKVPPAPPKPVAPPAAAKPAPVVHTVEVPQVPTQPGFLEKKYVRSHFEKEGARTQIDAVMGKSSRPNPSGDDRPPPSGTPYDGVVPAEGVTSLDLWKALDAPVQNREGRRAEAIYRNAINQFAVGHNPRYRPDPPETLRAHIFVWDLTRAMNAEVPHFVGAKELTLAQTCDWVRHEGPMRGWHRTDVGGAIEAANFGFPVLVLPKQVKIKLLAVVRPGKAGDDGLPRLAAATQVQGNDVGIFEALGVFSGEYFYHQ